MPVTTDDIIAAKIVCQLGLAPFETVRAALLAFDAQPETPGLDVTVDLLSRGAITRARFAKAITSTESSGNIVVASACRYAHRCTAAATRCVACRRPLHAVSTPATSCCVN